MLEALLYGLIAFFKKYIFKDRHASNACLLLFRLQTGETRKAIQPSGFIECQMIRSSRSNRQNIFSGKRPVMRWRLPR